MPTETLREFVEERLLAADPTTDLSEGSPYQVQVVDPIVRRFEPDPFEMDVDKFIEARLRQEYPDMDVREGSGVRDLLVKPDAVLLDPIQREVTLIKNNQSMMWPELLSPTEADAIAANLLVRRSLGGLATGRARMYFNAPVSVAVSLGNVFSTADGLNFHPSSLQSISADAMLFNQDGNLYYFDVSLIAEKPGSEYNIDKTSIVGVTNINTAVRVTNLTKFANGIDEEDTESLISRTEESITVRDLVVPRGVSARLRDQFADLTQLQVIGFKDDEMQRDVLVGGDMGHILQSGTDGCTDDDGDGDEYTTIFRTKYGNFLTSGGGCFHGTGDVADHFYLTASEVLNGSGGSYASSPSLYIFNTLATSPAFLPSDVGLTIIRMGSIFETNNGIAKIASYIGPHAVTLDVAGVVATDVSWVLVRPEKDYEIETILSSSALKLKSTTQAHVTTGTFSWAIRKKELTISEIPGGILLPTSAGTISIPSDEVHIGGCSDFYVSGVALEESLLVLSAISDEKPLVDHLTLATTAGSEWVTDPQVADWKAVGVKPGYSLIIDAGPNAATYTVLKIDPSNLSRMQIYPAPTSTVGAQRYRIIDTIDVNLREPRTMRGNGIDLQTMQLSTIVTTDSAVDFFGLGASEGDTLRLLGGYSKGDYSVVAISGTGNRDLQLGAQMKGTEDDIGWELFLSQEGMNLPLIRIKTVDILDSSKQQTGDTIPYAEPVDIRTSAFSNSGRGVKVSITDAITGIVGTLDLSTITPSTPLATCTLYISVASTTYTIPLTGSTSSSVIVDRINAVVPNIAALMDVAGEQRLTLRSTNRWLRVRPSAYNTVVGLASEGEDNRQIKSASHVSDWTVATYDLRAVRDAVAISTGDNIGYYYLVAVKSSKLLVVNVDEDNGVLNFLQPNIDVSVYVGARSYGKARLYFMEPTSCSVMGKWRPPLLSTTKAPSNLAFTETGSTVIEEDEKPVTYFTATINGTPLRFFPDPDMAQQLVPPVGSTIPNNLTTTASNAWIKTDSDPAPIAPETVAAGAESRVSEIDFLLKEVAPGDRLQVTHRPIQGVGADLNLLTLPDALQNLTLVMSIDGSPPKTCTFSDQLATVDDIIDEINEAFGLTIAAKESVISPAAVYLRLEADVDFILYGTGTANTTLGLPTVLTQNQAAAYRGDGYSVLEVGSSTPGLPGHYQLEVSPTPSVSAHSMHFIIYRPGMQRLHSTGMSKQLEIGLYYMDVEMVSEGVGDQWNLESGLQMTVAGHESDGYKLSVEDENFTFSMEETPWITFSRRILLTGVTDSPENATSLYGQNVQVNYQRSTLTQQVQDFASSDLERVLTANILVRHLMPHFLNFEIDYRGGSGVDVVEADVLTYLRSLSPDERVEVSSIVDLVKRRGASYVKNPITLIAIAHYMDRRVWADRSQDYVSVSRLATFFPDVITITRESPTVL